jgi:hypothetical protein
MTPEEEYDVMSLEERAAIDAHLQEQREAEAKVKLLELQRQWAALEEEYFLKDVAPEGAHTASRYWIDGSRLNAD